jgi:hypothetical protein
MMKMDGRPNNIMMTMVGHRPIDRIIHAVSVLWFVFVVVVVVCTVR